MGSLIESLSIRANLRTEQNVEVNFTLEVRTLEEGDVVMLSKAVGEPLSLSRIALPENCIFVEMNKGNKDILCPHNKDVVTTVMILVLEHLVDVGWKFSRVSIQSNQKLIDYPKIVEAYSRNTEVIFN